MNKLCALNCKILLAIMLAGSLSACRYPIQHGRLMTGVQKDRDAYERTRKGLATEQDGGATPLQPNSNTSEEARTKKGNKGTGLEIPRTTSASGVRTKPILLQRTGYITSYNTQTRCPDWVAWHLTADHTSGSYKRSGMKFHEDEDVPTPRATHMDYMNSGYDRGHMCPSGDNKWSAQAQQDCFLLTNICPQNHQLNSGLWNDLEMRCRTWANRMGDLYIVCGPIWGKEHRKIGRNKVAVPEGFFKAVLCTNGRAKAVGFCCPNSNIRGTIDDYAMSIDELEELTGLDFFYQLDSKTQQRIEAQYDMSEW